MPLLYTKREMEMTSTNHLPQSGASESIDTTRRQFLGVATVAAATLAMPLAASAAEATAAQTPAKPGEFTTNDGVKLSYVEAGSGKPLVMVPGWSQSAAEFKNQISGLSNRYRVIAIDLRGHGESAKPDHGYHIERLSADIHEFLVGNNLNDVALLGHSMGTSIIWGYWQQYGPDRVSKLILDDQMPMITSNPEWSEQEKQDAGSVFDCASMYKTVNGLAGPGGVKLTRKMITGMFTKRFPRQELDWVIQENLKMPRIYASRLLLNHSMNDWRFLIPRINIPTLVIGGKLSIVPWKSQVWVAHQIKGARLEIFEANEGGSHFTFLENPTKFNRIVTEFVG